VCAFGSRLANEEVVFYSLVPTFTSPNSRHKMEPNEPGHKFVETIQIWEHHFGLYPVAVIVYDSTGGMIIKSLSVFVQFFASFNDNTYLSSISQEL